MSEVSLLPPGSSPAMKALSLAFAEAGVLPEINLGDLWDPWRAPTDRLPSLAADLGVTLWKPDWADAKKRAVIARTLELKRRRGTRPAFETHIGFVDAKLEALRTAPQTATPRASKSAADRAAWAAQFPELRVYAYRRTHSGRALVTGRPWGGRLRATRQSQAPIHAGRRATLVRDGIERTVALRVVQDPSEFARQHLQAALSTVGRRMTAGRPLGVATRTSGAKYRLYGFRSGGRALDVLPPQLQPLDVTPMRVAAPAHRPAGLVAGRCLAGGRRFARRSTASLRIYDSFRLLDPDVTGRTRLRGRGGWFAGTSLLGQPAFEIRLDVNVTRARRGRRPFPFRSSSVIRAHDGQPTADVLAAVRAAKLGRDRVLVRTNLHRPIQAGDGVPLDGSYRLGQIVRSL